ncbi:MAG: nitrous oxide reductase accessory protein NosL [Bacteroidia bacterium]|nr:nitrous oxide reductase accessory protein NosL [Bacteroidota bacterium]MBP9081611.1 nitrous oxide reductase accessory protein NosL [Bacteroidia bacterium]MBK7391060.1 nitrous oxide reductase accessory protein NosL [Bacteroidota bacterium]MBK7968059.1 nitrous oxide reductase accessory protein NosL [Bacteroidota bacterium]MBK8417127.1 nitrous oxide reductase accessory protein NosL [Bacteroidota bacterium]
MKKLNSPARLLLLFAGIFLIISLFVPIWRIELDAPQYPEGLMLQIFANKLGGNVDIINGLNHYIGMKTLHTDDFMEFTLLPYIIGIFALISLLTSFAGQKIHLKILLFSFIAFGVLAMVDFWRWEYNYGHDLDPNAAIIVPGMAYQPPLIGFKQLLNFGAYSIPDIGGWLFISSGILMLLAFMKEFGIIFKKNIVASFILPAALAITITSCSGSGKEPIIINKEHCIYCKMMISDLKYAAEIVTMKGRAYKFDDLICLTAFLKEEPDFQVKEIYVSSFHPPHELFHTKEMSFYTTSDHKGPMGGNIIAIDKSVDASTFLKNTNATPVSWDAIIK